MKQRLQYNADLINIGHRSYILKDVLSNGGGLEGIN